MKTNFRQRNNISPHLKRLTYVALTLLVFGCLFFFFRSPIISIVGHAWRGQESVSQGFEHFLDFFRSKNSLIAENISLKLDLSSQEAVISSLRVTESNYEELLFAFGRGEEAEGIAGGVLSRPPSTPYDLLILDVGTNDGVELGDPVSLPQGGALGTVSEVFPRESKVALFSSPKTETPAVLERGGVSITLFGEGGGSFSASLPRDVAAEVGDRVLMPGVRAVLLGVVREVELLPTDSEKTLLISGVANISQIKFVLIRK